MVVVLAIQGQNNEAIVNFYKVSPELEPLEMSRGDVEISPVIFLLICNRPKHSLYTNLVS